jgi:Asp-tRNA(Asn)/Glu-tRNA(Gln) amidotransferase A subunit family amidase
LAAGAQTRTGGGGLKDLNQLDAGEIAKRVARREISPVEVIDAALARLDETHPADP